MNLRELGVKHRDIQIVLMLQRLQNIQGVTNQVEIGNNLGFSVKTVERRMRKLRELGWIEVIRTGSKTWAYQITDACPFQFCEEIELENLPADQVLLSSLCEPSLLVVNPPERSQDAISEPSNRDSVPSQPNYSYVYSTTEDFFIYTYDEELTNVYESHETQYAQDNGAPSKTEATKGKEMPEPKIIGPEEGALADLKKRLESGEKFHVGKRSKKMSKGLSRVSDEFNAEESAVPVREQKVFKAPKSRKEVIEAKEKDTYNHWDMRFIFSKLWNECNFRGHPTEWTSREQSHVKKLIEEQGSEAIIQYFEFCFSNWIALAHKHRISSVVPSIPILYGYRRSLLPEALNPQLRTSAPGAEYIESDVPSGSWGF